MNVKLSKVYHGGRIKVQKRAFSPHYKRYYKVRKLVRKVLSRVRAYTAKEYVNKAFVITKPQERKRYSEYYKENKRGDNGVIKRG